MIRRIATSIAGLSILCAASAHAGFLEEQRCASARYSAAGKYTACQAQVSAKNDDDQLGFLKCRQKYVAAWAKLGAKHPGTSCEGARFTDDGSTITDHLTQLVWEKKTSTVGSGENLSDPHDVNNSYTWSASGAPADGTVFTDFLDDLNSTGFAGQHDWRLPTPFELQTILSTDAVPCAAQPCVVDPLFSNAQSAIYWASATWQLDPNVVAIGDFTFGSAERDNKVTGFYVRAVRGGM